MASKSERGMNGSISKAVLKQLQENQSLRIQIFRMRTDMRDQHHHFLNQTIHQQMLVQKIITQMSLAYRRANDTRNYKQSHQIISNAVKHCIGNLQNLLEAYSRLKDQWTNVKQDDPAIYYQQLLNDCSLRFDKAESIIQQLTNEKEGYLKQVELKVAQIQFLQGELGSSHHRFQELVKESKLSKAQISRLQEIIESRQQTIASLQQQLLMVGQDKEGLEVKLKESKETISRHSEYLQNKYVSIQQQNNRLIQLHRQASMQKQQLCLIVQEQLNQIHSLNHQLQLLKTKFREIIDKEDKIKHLQKVNFINTYRPPLSSLNSSQNTIASIEQRPLKRQVGKMTKRFNLQSFQERIISKSALKND